MYNNNVFFLFILIIIIIIFYNTATAEHLTSTSVSSNEAIQLLGSVYNSGNATLTNLNITGTLKVGDITLQGKDITVDGWVIRPEGDSLIIRNLRSGKDTRLAIAPNVSGDIGTELNFSGANIGMWKIRGDSIGIPNRGDLNMAADKWVRFLDYGQPYNGTYAENGFAAKNLWAATGTVHAGKVDTPKIVMNDWTIYPATGPGFNWASKNPASVFRIDSNYKAKFEIASNGLHGSPSDWGNKGFF